MPIIERPIETGIPSDLTWAALTALEPRLEALLAEAEAITDKLPNKTFCANGVWYGYNGWPGLKSKLLYLVGWERGQRPERNHLPAMVDLSKLPQRPKVELSEDDQLLHSSQAYSFCYRRIYNSLPDCRGACGCMSA